MRLRISLVMFALMALALLAVARSFEAPEVPAAPRSSLKELVAVRRLAAHDAATRRNADAKRICDLGHQVRRQFGALFGTEPATQGAAFGEVRIGAMFPHPADGVFPIAGTERSFYDGPEVVAASATVADGRPLRCDPKDDQEIYCPFQCIDRADVDCWNITRDLTDLWGEVEHAAWRDRSGRARALVYFSDDMCTLQFARYVPAHQWIAMTATAEVPLGLIGEPVARLPAYADLTRLGEDEIDYRWNLAVTGDAMISAEINVHARRDRIVGIEVQGSLVLEGGADEVHELARPYRDGPFAVALSTTGTHFDLEIGER